MIIIATRAAVREIEGEHRLAELLKRFDDARDAGEQERAASEIEGIIGGRVRAMLVQAAAGRPIPDDQLDSLVTEATFAALRELQPRLKRSDIKYGDWTDVVERLRGATSGPLKKIWNLLPAETRQAVSVPYLKTTTQDQFVSVLNRNVLPRRDLYDQGWAGVSLPQEAGELLKRGVAGLSNSEVMRLNALLLQALFPGDFVNVPELRTDPAEDFFRVMSFTVKRLKPLLWEASGSHATPYDVDAWNLLKPAVAELGRIESGGEPPPPDAANWGAMSRAERVQFLYRRGLQREYGGKIQWWNKTISELDPGQPYVVRDDSSYRAARELFKERGVPAELYAQKGGQYWVPASAFKPIGLQVIERLLSRPGFGIPARSRGAAPAGGEAAAPAEMPALPSQQPMGPREYEMIANRLFSRPGFELEKSLAGFLAAMPRPTPQQAEQFVRSLPPELAETIKEVGFRNVVREVDQKILEALEKPEIQRWLSTLGREPLAVTAAVKRLALARTAQLDESLTDSMDLHGAVADDPLFSPLVDLLFSKGTLEHAVGKWLSEHAAPTFAELGKMEDALPGELKAQMGDRSIDQVVSDVWRVVDKLLAAMADDELRARMERRHASAYPGNERVVRVRWSRGAARKDFNLARSRARARRHMPVPAGAAL